MPVSELKFAVPEVQILSNILFRFDVCSLFIVGLCGNLNGATCGGRGLFIFGS